MIISKFFEEIAVESGKYVYGVADTMASLDTGALETILCYENLDYVRVTLKNKVTEAISYIYL